MEEFGYSQDGLPNNNLSSGDTPDDKLLINMNSKV